MDSHSVSVVIPTIGRETLKTSIQSAIQQNLKPLEIIVVDDSGKGEGLGLEPYDCKIIEIKTKGRVGPSEARNLGIATASGSFIAFLDDDDEWLPDHLKDAINLLKCRPEVDLYTSSGLVKSATRSRVEPRIIYSNKWPLYQFLYQRCAWARRNRRILTPTIVFRRSVGRVPLPKDLRVREDLWWLFEVEKAGYLIEQTANVGVIVNADDRRIAERQRLTEELSWAERLDTVEQTLGLDYLVGTLARQMALGGESYQLRRLNETLVLPYSKRILLGILTSISILRVKQRVLLLQRCVKSMRRKGDDR